VSDYPTEQEEAGEAGEAEGAGENFTSAFCLLPSAFCLHKGRLTPFEREAACHATSGPL